MPGSFSLFNFIISKISKDFETWLDKQLFIDGLRHEEVLIKKLKKQGFQIAELEGKQNECDYQETKKAMSDGYDFIWQASLNNEEMRGSADL